VSQLQQLAAAHGGWRVPLPFTPESLGITDPADRDFMFSRLTLQPLRPALQPVRLASAAAAGLPRSFVYCTSPALGLFDGLPAEVRAGGWDYHELPTGHMAPVTIPEDVARLLTSMAALQGPARSS
jgi:hypothetical protein